MKYNPDIHHRRSVRLKGYDYSQAGFYFITICTHNRKCIFGRIENEEMMLNVAGQMAEKYWLDIPDHYPDVVLHEHIVMPNHVHGIIKINHVENTTNETNVGASNVGAQNSVPLHPRRNQFQKIIPQSIGSIVRGYKIGVTKWVRANTGIHTVWQRNYYDHIIRDEKSCSQISEYIQTNPLKWQEDKYYA